MKPKAQGVTALMSIVVLFVVLSLPSHSAVAADRGPALFKLCTSCHGMQGQGLQNLAAPAIAGLPAWYTTNQLNKFQSGKRGMHPNDIAGMRMRPMARTLRGDSDIKAIADYVASLSRPKTPKTIEGDVTNGQARYAVCTACHQADASGNQALNAPPLKGINDWYMLTQLKNFKTGVRGNPAVDPIGSTMAPMARILENEQAMKDVIAYINSL